MLYNGPSEVDVSVSLVGGSERGHGHIGAASDDHADQACPVPGRLQHPELTVHRPMYRVTETHTREIHTDGKYTPN